VGTVAIVIMAMLICLIWTHSLGQGYKLPLALVSYLQYGSGG
jgi:hypothetical protein